MIWDGFYKGKRILIRAKSFRLVMKKLKVELDKIDRRD